MEKVKEVELPEKNMFYPRKIVKAELADHVCDFAMFVNCSRNTVLMRLADPG